MSSASTSAAVPLPAKKSRIAGHIFAIAGGVLAIISFFLPWVAFVANGTTFLTLTGLEGATGSVIQTATGADLFRSSGLSFIVPIVGVVALLLVLLALRRGYVTVWDAFGLMILGLMPLIVVWLRFGDAQVLAEKAGAELQAQIGLTGAILALIAFMVAGALDLLPAMERSPGLRGTLGAWSFMGPAGLLVIVFFFLPAIILFYISLTDLSSSNFGNPLTFIGLENYRRLFSDTFFPKILGNTFRYVILTLGIFNVGLALVLAILTTYIPRRSGFFFRTLWLLPRITPSVIYILMWQRIAHQPPFGIINQLLGPLGVESSYWLFEHPWTFVILANGFVGASFGLIIFSSAIESIPKDYFTAAKVDGASTWQTIRDITLPLIRWPLLFVTTYQTLSLLTSFEYILLLTNGGPGLFTTEVWALTAYKRALKTYFGNNQWGYGAAWGFILVIIGLVLSLIYVRVFRFDDLVQEPKIDVL
jgi:inositol-phosphate transport system permease protein